MLRTSAPLTSALGVMGRAALIWVSALLVATFVALDFWFGTARCSVSPSVYGAGVVIGALSQILSVALPIIVVRNIPGASSRLRLRAVGLSLLLVVASVPVLQASLLYSDGIGKGRAYKSVGIECHGPALRPGHGT